MIEELTSNDVTFYQTTGKLGNDVLFDITLVFIKSYNDNL